MSESVPRRRALIVGIDTYVPPAPAGAPPSVLRDGRSATDERRATYVDLAGSVRDARAVRQVLLDLFGFRPEEIRLLLDREATRAAILAGIEELRDGAGPGDEVFVYFAGHGSQVRNTLSDELDKLDESLVPADSAAGTPDLRDKELRRLANQVLDRGARLTVVLDSCHSGSALRLHVEGGRTRRLLNDTRDAADGPPYGPKPEDRGALVLSAALDDQPAREVKDEAGQWHGAFTRALVRALAVAGPRESAERLFLCAKARMLTGEVPQEPVLAATRARRQEPLLRAPAAARPARAKRMRDSAAGPPREAAAMPAAAVQWVWPNGTVILVGGIATALLPGCELIAEEADVRVEVTAAGEPGRAEARVVEGDTEHLAVGMLLQLSRWSVAGEPSLAVWIPAHPGPWEEVEGFARELERGAAAAGVRWIADPLAEAPAQVLAWMGEGWRLSTADGGGEDLGPRPRPAEVLGRAARLAAETLAANGAAAPAGLFVHLPAPAVLGAALRLGAGSANDAVERTAGPGEAHYRLVGRLGTSSVDFAWVRPGAGADDHSPLPACSDWVALPKPGGRGGGPAVAAHPLEQAALRLARIRSWLTLEPPPGDGFPYRLALRPAGGGAIRTEGELRVGEEYGLVLTARHEDLQTYIARRYVYVFLLDSWGRTRVFFPPATRGGVENRFPLERRGREAWWEEIPLGDQPLFRIDTPLGVDTYFLLTSTEPIPAPHVLEAAGVRNRGPHGRTALEELLSLRGGTRRSGPLLVPADWSLERLTFETVP